jgi:hypothetical protein
LRVCDGSDGQKAGEHSIDVGADLHDAAGDEDGSETADDAAHVFADVKVNRHRPEEAEDDGQLNSELQRAADHGSVGDDACERGVIDGVPMQVEGDDDGDVPDNGRRVGEEELAMRVQNTEAPGGEDQQADAREEDADELDGEVARRSFEARGDEGDENGRKDDAESDEDRCGESQQGEDGFGEL